MPRIPSGYRMVFFEDALRRGVGGVLEHYRTLVHLSLKEECRVLLVEEPARVVTWFRGRRVSRVAGAMSFAHNCRDLGWPILEDAWAQASTPLPGYCPGTVEWSEFSELGIPPAGGCRVEEADSLEMIRGCGILVLGGRVLREVRGYTGSEDPLNPVVQGLVGVRVEAEAVEVGIPRIWVTLLSVGGAPLLVAEPRGRVYVLLGRILDDEYSKLLRYNLVINMCRRDRCGSECEELRGGEAEEA